MMKVSLREREIGGGASMFGPKLGLDEPMKQDAESVRTNPARHSRPVRLLVVDDDRHVADAMALLLETRGYEVAVALSGPEAIELAAVLEPRIVFLDIGMAGMDGFETARRLRAAAPDARHQHLVAVSGYADEAFDAACRQAGFDRFVTKPVSRQLLNELLDALV